MRNFNLKQLFVTKTARLDLSMSKNRIYLIVYKPIDKKPSKDGKIELPIFRKIQENGTVIENKSAVKLSEYEIGMFISLLNHFVKLNYSTEKLYKLINARFSKLVTNQTKYSPEDKLITITLYRPEKKFNIQFSDTAGFRINLYENDDKYSITIPNEEIYYIKMALEFALEEYFKNFRFEIETDNESSAQSQPNNSDNTQTQSKIKADVSENNTSIEEVEDEEEDDFDI